MATDQALPFDAQSDLGRPFGLDGEAESGNYEQSSQPLSAGGSSGEDDAATPTGLHPWQAEAENTWGTMPDIESGTLARFLVIIQPPMRKGTRSAAGSRQSADPGRSPGGRRSA